mmetsp:Transcript_24151/g.51730  ORF Transcript_24151/g.51730 Transcript_24151/m.51730 type:complete len:253 (-) Transcript_24151:729-1487(-)
MRGNVSMVPQNGSTLRCACLGRDPPDEMCSARVSSSRASADWRARHCLGSCRSRPGPSAQTAYERADAPAVGSTNTLPPRKLARSSVAAPTPPPPSAEETSSSLHMTHLDANASLRKVHCSQRHCSPAPWQPPPVPGPRGRPPASTDASRRGVVAAYSMAGEHTVAGGRGDRSPPPNAASSASPRSSSSFSSSSSSPPPSSSSLSTRQITSGSSFPPAFAVGFPSSSSSSSLLKKDSAYSSSVLRLDLLDSL